jgi:hypothetical protein
MAYKAGCCTSPTAGRYDLRFAEIVCSSQAVRSAFDAAPTHRWWWKAVLSLHGKPVRVDLTDGERKTVLSKGFRFYAILYASLGILMVGVSVMLVAMQAPQCPHWSGAAMLSGVYLVGNAALAFKGASRYVQDTTGASALLLAFFVAIIAFLVSFGGTVALIIKQHMPQYGAPSLILLAVFVAFGVGSYVIEVLFLFFSCAARPSLSPYLRA